MKRIVSVFLAALMLLLLSSCRGADDTGLSSSDVSQQAVNDVGTTTPVEENIIKIGVFEPQSGENGSLGKQEILGIMYANQCTPTVRVGGKEMTVKLIYTDNESSPEKAKAVAKALVEEGVSAVIGSVGSDVTEKAADIFAAAGIPLVAASCTGEAVTEKGETCYRVGYTDPYQARALAAFTFKQLGIQKVYILAPLASGSGQGLSLYFREAFESLGGTVITENFLPGTTDFSAALKKAVKNECKAVFAPVSLVCAEKILEQAGELDSELTLIGDSGWDCNVVLKAAGQSGVRVYVASYYQKGVNEAFETGIKAWLASNPALKNNSNNGDDIVSAACAAGYDAYHAVVQAIKSADSAGSRDINEALKSVELDGACSVLKFLSNRNASRSFAYVKTTDGSDADWTAVCEQKF